MRDIYLGKEHPPATPKADYSEVVLVAPACIVLADRADGFAPRVCQEVVIVFGVSFLPLCKLLIISTCVDWDS